MRARRSVVVTSVAVAAASLIAAPAASATVTDLYVQPSGADSVSCGASASPCKTIGQAITNADLTGTTIHVAAGQYPENVTPRSGQTVTIVGNGRSGTSATVVNPPDGAALGAAISKRLIASNLRVEAAKFGAGIVNGGEIDLTDVTFEAVPCAVYGAAGVIDVSNSVIDQSGSIGTGCGPSNFPGSHDAVYVGGATVSFSGSTLSDFDADTTTGVEVASGLFTARDSTLSDIAYLNSSSAQHGAAVLVDGGTATIDRSLLYADFYAIQSSGGSATISDSTIYGAEFGVNTTAGSGPTFVRSSIEQATVTGAISLAGTVLQGGFANGNCSNATVDDLGYNFSSDNTCVFSAANHSHDNVTNLNLDSKGNADNGGPTQTIAVESPSALINAIPTGATLTDGHTPLCPPATTDQRGRVRPQGSACDAGAFEVAASRTALSASANPAAPGANVTLTATVTPYTGTFTDPDHVAGNVTFMRGTTVLCTADRPLAANGRASCTTTKLPPGRDTVTASFTASAPYLDSTGTKAVVIGTAPRFTSPNSAKATVGVHKTITIHASGSPAPLITKTSGTLPAGMHFTSGHGSATIAGTPARGTAKEYVMHLRAANVRGAATQTFTLTVISG